MVRHAGVLSGKSGFSDYLVLGDDVVIANETVAENYLKIIKGIGIGISQSKSILPGIVSGVEFASKYVLGKDNLSPLPVGLMLMRDLPRKISLLESISCRMVKAGVGSINGKEDLILKTVFHTKDNQKKLDSIARVFAHSVIFREISKCKMVKNTFPLGALPKSVMDLGDHPFEVVRHL